jgi:hypothetical protein
MNDPASQEKRSQSPKRKRKRSIIKSAFSKLIGLGKSSNEDSKQLSNTFANFDETLLP